MLDLWVNDIQQLKVTNAYESSDCPCCKNRDFEYLDGKAGSSAASLCGRNAVQLRHRQQADGIDIAALAKRLRAHGEVSANEFMLRTHITDGNKKYEITLFPDGRAIIKGTDEPGVARSIYAKYVGS
jgi:adenylyltransferase/sulfurtransferase